MKFQNRLRGAILLMIVLGIVMGYLIFHMVHADPLVIGTHEVIFVDNKNELTKVIQKSNVYDGDTIQRVLIDIADLEPKKPYPAELIFPNVLLDKDDIYVIYDIRIKGIDTAEKRVSKKYKDGTRRPESERKQERETAILAQKTLQNLLAKNKYQFRITNISEDKYFGRLVADVLIGEVNVAKYMIEQGLAYPYDGGTKKQFHEWFDPKKVKN